MATGTVVYSKWERVKKIYKGKEVTQIMPVTHTETITEVILNLAQEVETLAEHLFVASWQQKQFTNLQHNIPQSWVVLNMDFAENYACIAQKEVQGAHWSHNQVTVHPTVAYYRCPVEGCKDTVMEHLIFISEDLTHDAAAVQEFVKIANNHLIKVRGLKIEKEIQMTDGCAAQYKSRIPFTDISFCQTDFGFSVERHFYGSRHGKGPSDGAGAVVKSSVRRAVNGEKVIVNNSKDFFECAKKMTKEDEGHKEHFRRTIFHVAAMNHNRPERSNQCRTLKGTRKIQAIKAVDQMIIQTRNLSCFCEGCINGDSQACVNRDYVSEWELQDIKKAERPVLTARNVGAERGRRRVNAQRGVRQRGQGRGVRRQRGQGRGGLQRGNRRGNTQRGNARGGAQRGGRTGVRQRGQCRGARQRGQGRREKRGRKRKRSDTEFSSSDSESDIALSDLEDDVTDEDSRSAVIPRAGISDLEDDVTDEDSRSAVIPRAGVSDMEDNVTDEDSRSAVIPRAGVSDMEDNVTDEDSRSRRYAVIPRTRGGLKTRGGVRTRGGTRNSTPNACASQSLFALPLDCEVGTSTDFNMFALPLSGCEVGSSTDFQTMDNTDFQTMDITALLEVIDRSMSGSRETMQQPHMVETRQQPHYVEIQQLPFSVQTEQSPSVEVLLQLPNIETEGTPSVSTVQQPSVVSMQPPSVETVQLSGVEIMQPHSVESVQPPNVKNAQLPIVKSVQPPTVESIQPPSVKSVQPPSVESLQPHSVGSVQPSIFKFGQSHSVKSVQLPSVESVQPTSVKFLQSPSVKSIQQPIVESVQPPSVESMRPPGVESVHPTSVETVESVQPPCVKSVLPPSFESVQPPSVESVQPPSVQTQKQMSSRYLCIGIHTLETTFLLIQFLCGFLMTVSLQIFKANTCI